MFDLWQLWDGAVREINPDSCVIPNTGGGATSSLDMRRIGELAPTLIADRQARRGLTPPWANGKNAKEFRATMGGKPIVGIFSVGLEEPYRWKDSVQSDPRSGSGRWRASPTVAALVHQVRRRRCTTARWLPVVEKIYRWHHADERYLRVDEPLARVGMVYSQQTAWFYGGDRAGQKVEDHTLGMYHALIEGRVPFEMVHDRLARPGAYRAVQAADPAEYRRPVRSAM